MRAALRAIVGAAALYAAPAPGIELRVEDDRVIVSGKIAPDDDFVLLTALVEHRSKIRVVHLHESPGGDMAAALRMGRIIRARDLDTLATSLCMSGCALAFLGGVNRRFADDGSGTPSLLALHGPFDTANPDTELPEAFRVVIADYVHDATGGRADRSVVERILRLKANDFMVFATISPPPGRREATRTGVAECKFGGPSFQATDFASRCVVVTGTTALEQGFVTTNFVYRLTPGTPYRRP